ncbi:hypothetical protein CDAR_433941 [Caerostris darwini]|uniref:Uncharacterized protein n=1 Tax=Caerostris darwini TaxID=1538125 RepID=A0AAV4R0A5_9ARAC|nr:hypothetical protein CDAR_433941 [Caerostris darwini]
MCNNLARSKISVSFRYQESKSGSGGFQSPARFYKAISLPETFFNCEIAHFTTIIALAICKALCLPRDVQMFDYYHSYLTTYLNNIQLTEYLPKKKIGLHHYLQKTTSFLPQSPSAA